MTDIVKRLRNWLNQGQQEQHETALEAADEIERLREELDIWQSVFPDVAPERVQPDRSLLEKEIERLRAEIERLRAEIKAWRERFDPYGVSGFDGKSIVMSG